MAVQTPPTMPGSRTLGSLPDFMRSPLELGLRANRQLGDVVHFVLGPPGLRQDLYGVYHPDGAEQLLAARSATNYRKDQVFYQEMRNLFGDGLVTSQDDTWLRQKRFIQPLFTVKRVDGYAATMAEEVERFTVGWRSRSTGVVDLWTEMTSLTLPLAVRILFGDDAHTMVPILQSAFPVLNTAVRKRGLAPVKAPLHWPTPANRRIRVAQEQIYGVCDEIIARRRASGVNSDDLVGRLVSARDGGEGLTDEEVRDQVMIFLLAGQETTSIALTFALWLLGRHPDIQARVREEADRVLTDSPTAAEIKSLTYAAMVVKEATRLFPPVPFIGRNSAEEDSVCGFALPAGAQIALSPWVIHRRADIFPNPHRFEPERFSADREKSLHRYAWFPFGHGPRGCIGQHFAMLEAALALAYLVREFELVTPSGIPNLNVGITLLAPDGVPCYVRRRE